MPDLQELVETIAVPPGTGVEGFLQAVRSILKKGMVQRILITLNGHIETTRYVRQGEEDSIAVDFTTLLPSSVIRSCADICEVPVDLEKLSAAQAVATMFQAVSFDHLAPIAFATGTDSTIWRWHQQSTGIDFFNRKTEFYGLPLFVDSTLPSYGLFLCAGFRRDAAMVDTHKVYKVLMPEEQQLRGSHE